MASFSSESFLERDDGSGGYVVWAKAVTTVAKKIPGSGDTVIQVIGNDLPRLALPAAMTAAQLTAMYAKVGVSGSLVFSYETTTARLESIDAPTSIGVGNDLYFAVLNFIRTSGSISSTPANARLTEAGAVRLTEAGNIRIIE